MRKNKRTRLARIVGALALAGMLVTDAGAGPVTSAEVEVNGASLLRNRELGSALARLLGTRAKAALDANTIEDGAVILSSALGEEGFLKPEIEIDAKLADGGRRRFVFDPTFATPIPRPLEAVRVNFNLKRGVRYHIDAVQFTGLQAIPGRQARAYFRSDATLIAEARTNAFSPARLDRAVDVLVDELRRRGFVEAEVKAEPEMDDGTGKVVVRVMVKEGAEWRIADVTYRRDEAGAVTLPPVGNWLRKPWSPTVQEDIREEIRQAYYAEGYPDIGVHVAAEADSDRSGKKAASVVATIVPGPRVAMGDVRFEGNRVTRLQVLTRRVNLKRGEPLNLVEIERARYRIARLGVFESVELRYEPAEGNVRSPVFAVAEAPRYETSLLMGYGSYEQLRGGIEHRQMNILGFAHQSRLELIQSMKSTSGEYTYTVPELFGESLDGTARLFGLQRREIAFVRQEYGVDLALKRRVRRLGGDFAVGYTFEAARNRDNSLATEATDDRQINVASVNVGLTGDRRDNPLRPRHGYHWSARLEAADPRLGGQATYQRFEFAGSYHTSWGRGRWIHVGLAHGGVTSFGAETDRSLPVTKRFFPGGDNSIRGYRRGEAAPRRADGRFIGAKSYLFGALELEQALTPNWSLVAFGDALGSAVSLRDYPAGERLYAAGLGVRYQTLIGPLRMEYGRNLNPRPADPSGTWQFSIGYPF